MQDKNLKHHFLFFARFRRFVALKRDQGAVSRIGDVSYMDTPPVHIYHVSGVPFHIGTNNTVGDMYWGVPTWPSQQHRRQL